MAIPLARATTRSRDILEAPHFLIWEPKAVVRRPTDCVIKTYCRSATVSFDALLQACAQRLNMAYYGAGLIIYIIVYNNKNWNY